MPHYSLTRALPFAPHDMYELIAKIERYPEFLRWIQNLQATPPKPLSDTVQTLDAEVVMGFRGLSETFTTRLKCDSDAQRVDIKLLRGPLKRLDAVWQITPDPKTGGSKIGFEMVYAFSNPVLALMAKMNMSLAVERVMTAFTEAAHTYYTPVKPPKPNNGKPYV